ncbi:MAG: GerMN domain-containing protein [Bacillota bacterium]
MNLKESGKKLLVGVGILLLLGLAAGCSAGEKISWRDLAKTHEDLIYGRIPKSGAAAKKESANVEQQALGEDKAADKTGAANTDGKADAGKKTPAKVKVTLYFANSGGDMLVPAVKTIDNVPGIARATLEELMKGPGAGKDLAPTIPSGTRLKDIDIHDGVATVDFSKEFVDNHWGGSSGELLTVYSVVDVLTQFPTVEKVQFLVEGRKVETLAGHMDLAQPVMRNTEYILDK